jgi:hypothetical protein
MAGSGSTDDRIRIIKELAELRTAGVLSEEEFVAEKRRVLGA